MGEIYLKRLQRLKNKKRALSRGSRGWTPLFKGVIEGVIEAVIKAVIKEVIEAAIEAAIETVIKAKSDDDAKARPLVKTPR